MYYKDYETYRDNAWQMHVACGVNRLPVDVRKLSRAADISIYSYSAAHEVVERLIPNSCTDGFAMIISGRKCIFYDDSTPACRQNFTIAHELGHYINGDVHDAPTKWNKEPRDGDKRIEMRANMVAARILAPACVLWALKINDAPTLAQVCNISIQAAEWRLRRLRILYAREADFYIRKGGSCFCRSPLERQVLQQFQPFIQEYWKKLNSQEQCDL